MAEKNTVEDVVYSGGESMIYTVSELSGQVGSTTQAIYIAYDAPSGAARLMPEVDMFSGQYILHSDESDILTSIFCGDIELSRKDVSIVQTNSVLAEGISSVEAFSIGTTTLKTDFPTDEVKLVTSASPVACCDAEDAKIPQDFSSLLTSSSEAKVGDETKRKQSVFSAIQATLSQEFLSLASEDLRDAMRKMTSELCLQMVHSSETNLFYLLGSNLEDFVQLEKIMLDLLDTKVSMKSAVTCDTKPETCDRGTMCFLLQPQFTRSGREVRYKDRNLYEEIVSTPSPRSQSGSKIQAVKDSDTIGVKRRRGRPPRAARLQTANTVVLGKPDVVENRFDCKTAIAPGSEPATFSPTNELVNSNLEEQPAKSVDESFVELEFSKGKPDSDGETVDRVKDTKEGKSTDNHESNFRTGVFKRSLLGPKDYESRAPFKHCPICSFRTKRDSHLQKHIQLHDRNISILHCSQCSFCTTRQNHLTRHEMQHKSTVYRCDEPGCEYRTDSRRLLQRHSTLRHCTSDCKQERQRASQPTLECPVTNCSYKTHRAHLIRRHLVRHTAVDGNSALVERYSCRACSYETNRREHYLRHINAVHSDLRPYLCDNCGRSFKRKDSLVQHSIVHQEKSCRVYHFECQTCHTKFRSQGHLLDHQAKHTNDRSYLCEICGSSFKTKAVQRKHILSIHSKPRSFVCSTCSKHFNTSYALRRHAVSHSVKSGGPGRCDAQSKAAPQETVSVANVNQTIQVTVLTGLPSVDQIQGGIVSIQPQIGHIPAQIVGPPQIFAIGADVAHTRESAVQFLQQPY